MSLIILVLSHSGYWLGGTDGTLSARWIVPEQSPRATLVWELYLGSLRLGHGSVGMNAGDRNTATKIPCPAVRVRTDLDLKYRLLSPDGKTELASGTAQVHAFPADLTDGWSHQLAGKDLVVVDSPDGLPALLRHAGVPFTRVNELPDLQLMRPDMVLVGVDRLDDSPFTQGLLTEQATAGAGVMIFEQSHVDRMSEFAVVHREKPDRLDWSVDHPLLAHLSADDLQSWVGELAPDVRALRVMPSSSARPIASISGEIPMMGQSRPTDSLMVDQRIGRGRIVWCQLRLGNWRTDPRTVLLLGNALDYLSNVPALAAVSKMRMVMPIIQRRGPTVPTVLTPPGDDR